MLVILTVRFDVTACLTFVNGISTAVANLNQRCLYGEHKFVLYCFVHRYCNIRDSLLQFLCDRKYLDSL